MPRPWPRRTPGRRGPPPSPQDGPWLRRALPGQSHPPPVQSGGKAALKGQPVKAQLPPPPTPALPKHPTGRQIPWSLLP